MKKRKEALSKRGKEGNNFVEVIEYKNTRKPTLYSFSVNLNCSKIRVMLSHGLYCDCRSKLFNSSIQA